jgi:hypothetical protein
MMEEVLRSFGYEALTQAYFFEVMVSKPVVSSSYNMISGLNQSSG